MAGAQDNGDERSAPASALIRAPGGLRALLFTAAGTQFALLEWPAAAPGQPAKFGAAEGEVLRLLARGLSNAEIARARGRSTRTVANQVARIFRKLGVRSRLELFALLSAGRPREEDGA